MSAAPLRRLQEAPARPRPAGGAASAAARANPVTRPATESRPRLRAVGTPEQARSLAPFAWGCVLIILGALSTVLLLNTAMAQGAYERRDLKIEIANLHQERSSLVTAIEANSAPTRLANAATELGMRPAETYGFVSLADADSANRDQGDQP
ncbi:hypothetical protein ACNI3K_07155 [Demequina sp. SO4-13]|uniref:hypothetical protein n=1 Tax=Demequina sp. SO4-13 TaxID=3401027 RepID=UPI003AF6D41E